MRGKRILTIAAALTATASVWAQRSDTATISEGMRIERGRTRTEAKHPGIKRIRTYDITSQEIPATFDGYRMAFVTDMHYPSLFTDETLASLGTVLKELHPDAILLGGDYQEDCEHVEPLFKTIMECSPKDGAYAVLGNNDLERCTDVIVSLMKEYGITLVEDTATQIKKGHSHITVAGVRNTFQPKESHTSPTLKQPCSDFVILLTHTPDYAEDQDITNADITLAGHTHGGQVTLFGAWAPITASHYGQRFLKGHNKNSAGQAVITSTGIGTSRRAVRLFAPSEVILLRLHSLQKTENVSEEDKTEGESKETESICATGYNEAQESLDMPKKM